MKKLTTRGTLIFIILLFAILLVAFFIYFLSLYQDKKLTTASLKQEKNLVIEDLNSLKSEYDKAILESNATNEELVAARDNLAKYIDSVQTMKADIASLSRYRRQVSVLKAEREELLRKVDSLTTSNTLLSMQRDSTFVELEKQTVFNDSLVVQNTQLADAIERGSALNLSTFTIDAVRERNSGRLVSTSRAGTTEKLKVCFTVADNVIAEAGDREFFIELLDPQGNVLGESYTKTDEDGASIAYSKGTFFYYENSSLDVCDYVNRPVGGFQGGKYMVNVYDDGLRLLGSSKFTLKGTQSVSNRQDTDGDGIYDKDDPCPEIAGLEGLNGCPDFDGDGVVDGYDACPNEAGPSENNGCPWADSDGDGIDDSIDWCPNIAGSLGNNGCPESNMNSNKSILNAPLSSLSPETRSLKQFPWPPPQYSKRIVLHSSYTPLEDVNECDNLGCVTKIVTNALDKNDYEHSFYLISKDGKFKGYAIAALWEEFDKEDGSLIREAETGKSIFTLIKETKEWKNLMSLVMGREGYFRVIVFAITNLNDYTRGKTMSADKVEGLPGGGSPAISAEIESEPFSNRYRIIAYVYAYKIKEPSFKPEDEELYKNLSARKHLKGAQLELLLPD
ncbi:thrombospondin type 3 repeat-containing protein [Flagellimonas algicola]|uniref:Thrombospondin type 3 repeat-containing protein n=1 Tax=Flagellimonas algicola TaxID=2583815 RepID=A0ABY2WR39_9FLAO|nr:thrombospondin type 3 repeat-containing protein [Allomuricauda algicola]TMU57469.1 hypothetical protein FGG15_07975 [Allomuricauda algicola]